jgi:branched-chain amino acid aminotransferase
MTVATFKDGAWSAHHTQPVAPLEMHPGAHVLHYASSCFEGFKAFRWSDGALHVFRMDRHIARLRQSARALVLPDPDPQLLAGMIRDAILSNAAQVPINPGALYLRPLLIGTARNIGAAATPANEAMLVVLASPVWDYFGGGMRPLRIFVEEQSSRTASHTGQVKTGGNYAAALGPTMEAKARFNADQVLFCPGGQVQETGAANFLLLRRGRLLTRSLDTTFLRGVTRDSLLHLARDSGYEVEERIFDVGEMLEWIRDGEAALSGTAAVLAGVGVLVQRDREHVVGSGEVGVETRALRERLVAIQSGEAPDSYGWTSTV